MLPRITTIAWYTALEAIRGKLFWLVAGIALFCLMLGFFIGELAITESAMAQGSICAALLRLSAVFMVALFAINTVSQDLQAQRIDMLLALRLTRAEYSFGKFFAFCLIAGMIAACMSVSLLFFVPVDQVLGWGISLAFELCIVVAFALFCAISLNQMTLAIIVVMCFYLLARSINAIQLMINTPIINNMSSANEIMRLLVDVVQMLLPNLDHFTQTEWLIYGTSDGLSLVNIFLQTVVYCVLLMSATLFDLYRKEF